MFHTIVSIKNDGHYFCRAGGNRPDGLNEPVTYKKCTSDDLSLGGPATISSQAYAYYMQNVPFCIFVPTAHDDLSLCDRVDSTKRGAEWV